MTRTVRSRNVCMIVGVNAMIVRVRKRPCNRWNLLGGLHNAKPIRSHDINGLDLILNLQFLQLQLLVANSRLLIFHFSPKLLFCSLFLYASSLSILLDRGLASLFVFFGLIARSRNCLANSWITVSRQKYNKQGPYLHGFPGRQIPQSLQNPEQKTRDCQY